jgi:hypothetical protein
LLVSATECLLEGGYEGAADDIHHNREVDLDESFSWMDVDLSIDCDAEGHSEGP